MKNRAPGIGVFALLTAAAAWLLSGMVWAAGERPPAWAGPPAKRIASLAPSTTEILYALGAQELVGGVSRQCDHPVAAKLKPKVGDFNRPDVEALSALRPDVVLFTEYVRQEDLREVADAGFPVLVLPARTVTEVIATVRVLGDVTGRRDAARDLAEELESGVKNVRARVSEVPRASWPSVYLEVDGPNRLYAVGVGSFMHDALTIAGGRNVFAGRSEAYFEVSGEDVVTAAPDVILIDHPFQYKVGVSKRPGWSDIPAVRKGRVYDSTDFDMILLNRPGPRIVRSLEEVSRLLHPEGWHAPQR